MSSRSIIADDVVGIFFPMAGALGIGARATVSPAVERKMVWAGANLSSYEEASAALKELAGLEISAQRIRRAVERIGQERLEERKEAAARYEQMDLLARQVGSQAVEAPEVGVISMDGGRYQRRELFGQVRAEGQTHWRESKVGCLLSMRSVEAAEDPHPELPDWLFESRCVRELASPMGPMGLQEAAGAEEPEEESRAWEGPELVAKEVLASGEDGESFGRQLGGRAWQRGFLRARRLAFVADGAGINWQVHQEHFPQAMPILDLMHALSYAYGASRALKEPEAYVRWAGWIWSGQVDRVIGELDEYRRRLGPAPPDGSETEARQWVDRAWTYYQNHRSRMNYPEYRRLGLPLTSSHMESTIKQINRRVKGTEKFWTGRGSEAVLQLRADYLSDSQPMRPFWLRRQANQTGSNAYHHSP